MTPPPAASPSPANSPIASMSVLRTTSPCNRLRLCCSLYPALFEVQHSDAVLLEAASARALRLARQRFLAPERIDMSALAQELGVNRVTLYRWVGSRDKLLVEVVWSLAAQALDFAKSQTDAHGAERIVETVTRFLRLVIDNAGMRRWLSEEGEHAMRLLTRHDATFQPRLIQAIEDLLQEEADTLALPVDLHELAYVIVRVIESYT